MKLPASFLALVTLPVFAGLLAGGAGQNGQSLHLNPQMQLAHDVFKELIEIDTTDSSGSTTAAAEAMAARLISARAQPTAPGSASRASRPMGYQACLTTSMTSAPTARTSAWGSLSFMTALSSCIDS
jgi:hypothetical protein